MAVTLREQLRLFAGQVLPVRETVLSSTKNFAVTDAVGTSLHSGGMSGCEAALSFSMRMVHTAKRSVLFSVPSHRERWSLKKHLHATPVAILS